MGAVLAVGPVNGSRLRKTVSEREAIEQESKDITRKVRQATETWNQEREEITQAVPSRTNGPTAKSRKVKSTPVLR